MPSRTEIINLLKEIAPLHLAETWDNVGLLVDPPSAAQVDTVFLTIDLTEEVLDEAIEAGAQLIVAYHPPIFSGLKRLTMGNSTQRVVLRALAAGVSIYSPHTALDAAPGGLCDWLLEAFGAVERVRPITAHRTHPGGHSHGLQVAPSARQTPAVAALLADLTPLDGLWVGPEGAVERVASALASAGVLAPVQRFEQVGRAETGAGRRAQISEPQPLDDVVHALKAHLDLPYLRVAAANAHLDGEPIRSVAVCPGAGGSLFAPSVWRGHRGIPGVARFVSLVHSGLSRLGIFRRHAAA